MMDQNDTRPWFGVSVYVEGSDGGGIRGVRVVAEDEDAACELAREHFGLPDHPPHLMRVFQVDRNRYWPQPGNQWSWPVGSDTQPVLRRSA